MVGRIRREERAKEEEGGGEAGGVDRKKERQDLEDTMCLFPSTMVALH